MALGALAYVVLQNQADAEQVVIESLAEALRRPEPLAQTNQMHELLAIAARRLSAVERRGGNVDPMVPSPLPRDGDVREAELDRRGVMVAMSHLPIAQRVAIALQQVTDLSPEEIAAVVRRNPAAVRTDLAKARAALIAAMESREASQLEVVETVG